MSVETDTLLGLIDQENARVIHYQEERTTTTNIIFVVVGIIIAIIGIDQNICGNADTILSLILIPLGLLGAFLNYKYHERIYYHELLHDNYSEHLNKLLPKAAIGKAKRKAKETFAKETRLFKFITKSTLWAPWVMVNFITVAFGIIVLVISIEKAC